MNNDFEKAAELLKTSHNKKYNIKTGFRDLDYVLKDLDNGSIIVIGGRPSMGKTSLCTDLVINFLEQNKKVLFFNFADNKNALLKMFLRHKGGFSIEEKNEVILNKKLNEATAFFSKYDNNLLIFDNLFSNIEEIENIVNSFKPDYIFIDDIQSLNFGFYKNLYINRLDYLIKKFKENAVKNDATIFITSQLDRRLENREDKCPKLCDLKSSKSLTELASVVIFIYRDFYYNANENKESAELLIEKNQNGQKIFIPVIFKNGIFMDSIQTDNF